MTFPAYGIERRLRIELEKIADKAVPLRSRLGLSSIRSVRSERCWS